MPKPPLPEAVVDLLVQPCHATISTVRPDGQPVSVPTWYLYEAGRILVSMDNGRKRIAYLRADPRVSISVMDPQDWGTHVSVQGRAVEFHDDPELVDSDRIAIHYTGHEYPNRTSPRLSAWIEIDRWNAWGRLKDIR